jgi:heat shock protein HtpX
MTIYTHTESNIRKTWLLVSPFFVLVIGVGWAISYIYNNPTILVIAAVFSILMSVSSYWESDKIILSLTKASPIEKKDNPELYRIVENLCITAGLPTPKIYILPEAQMNAFATGRDKNHAVIAVTQGLLEKLDKNELEGVIAHELSHIGNKDMLLMTMVVVLVGFVSIVSDMFIRSAWFGGSKSRDNHDNNQAGVIMVILSIVLILVSPFIATLIQLTISRKREFLADASGALLTRYPEGLASALEKLGQDSQPMKKVYTATAHLYIANPLKKKSMSSLFLTHPPIEDRIKALRGMII